MQTSKLFRLFLLIPAAMLLIGLSLAAAATALVGDISGDGKVSAFDAQMLAEYKAGNRTLTEEQIAASGELTIASIMETVWGGKAGCADTDNAGVYELYTARGLSYMAQNPELDYILINNIDLKGADWTPVVGYSGSFDGNGKTISNFSITQSTPACSTFEDAAINMGFFGDTVCGAEIKDLHLRDVTVTAAEEALYMGLLVGSNRCAVTGCTVTGMIYDNRESHEEAVYIGIMAGRICSTSADKPGSIVGGTGLSMTDGAGAATTDGLCAKAAIIVDDSDNVNGRGLIGWYPSDAVISGAWADTSNDSRLLSQTIQSRQAKVVDYMNKMGTAQWIPSEDLTYTPEEGGGKTYYAGTTYYGLPYNRNYGSYERFLSALNEDGTTVEGLGSCIWNKTDGYHGFVQLMGNNCSSAVAWAWMQVSPVVVTAIPSHSTPYHGGVYVRGTSYMIPNDTNRTGYGVYPVGQWTSFCAANPETGRITDAEYDASLAAYACTDEVYSGDVLQANGANVILEAYAQAHKADAIVAFADNWSATLGDAGHARLLTVDPVVIRNADGSIDPDRSYMVTTEQGASTGSTSTWRVAYTYSFRNLLDDSADAGSTGYWHTYLPVTMRALRDDATRDSYVRNYTDENAVTGPITGKIYSNYHVVSTTVTVKNGEAVIYSEEVFTGIGCTTSEVNGKFQTVDLNAHSDGFTAAAQAAGLTAGTYTFSVQALLSDGKLVDAVTDQEFTYTATEQTTAQTT